MVLPPALEAFSRLPFWSIFFLLLAVAVAACSAWSFSRHRQRQDLFYMLLGLYLFAVQLPAVLPSLGEGLWAGQPLPGSTLGILLAIPAVLLFILGVRAR